MSRSTATSGSSMSRITRLQAAFRDLLALPGGERAQQQRLGRHRVLEVAAEAALLAQLRQRVAATRGLEQVGAQQRVVGQPAAGPRRGTWRRGRPPGAASHATASSSGLAQSPTRPRPQRPQRSARRGPPRTGPPPEARPGAPPPADSSGGREARDVPQATLAHARRERHLGRGGGQRHKLGVREGLFQAAQGVAELVLAEDLPQARAIGLVDGLGLGVEVERRGRGGSSRAA